MTEHPPLSLVHGLNEEDNVAREAGQRAVAQAADEALKQRADANLMTQRILDEAMADVVEIVRRHRTRVGRKVCSVPDGKMIREIFALLRNMAGPEISADNDPSWGG